MLNLLVLETTALYKTIINNIRKDWINDNKNHIDTLRKKDLSA